MKILQIIKAQDNAVVRYADPNGDCWYEPIVALGLIEDDGFSYVDSLVLSDDGEIVPLDVKRSRLGDNVIDKVIWNEK